ncbi:MAG: hypothetical protein HY787_05120 [Deltaproteobacteria bacterium]|nr:hypothetical protein [Deltaproteobacteria bacterium]
MKKSIGWLGWLFLALTVVSSPLTASDAPGVVVGRVYHLEGDLLRYVPAENDWVAVVKDAPFGTEDTLYAGSRGMAELIVPNGTWIRIGNDTQIQFMALEAEVSEVDVAAGLARFYNKGSSPTVIKATSPFGYVLAHPGAVFDFYVGENSVEVVPIKGKVSFVHWAGNAKYDVSAGSPSILADGKQLSSGEGTADPDWDRWNRARDDTWSARTRIKGRSVDYLPPSLWDEAYDLDDNGRWYRIYYEGAERWFWRPTNVYVGWAPFTVGRWTDWYDDQCWIPAEPFGYITHHYGNWVYVDHYWYWAPPVVRARVGLPLLHVGFFWYPGRVSWIHSGIHVGWIPLAPHETYYSHRNWGGPRVVVVTRAFLPRIQINLRNYAYLDHAIVVDQNHFHRVNDYRNIRLSHVNRAAILNDYRAAPVVNDNVIKNYSTIRQRHQFANIEVKEKPHRTVVERIRENEKVIRQERRSNAATIEQQVRRLPEGRVQREARIETPKVRNYIVPADKVNRPESEIRPQRREIRRRGEGVRPIPEGRIEPRAVRPLQPQRIEPERRERREPIKPVEPPAPQVQPGAPERGRPGQAPPGRLAPARPAPIERPREPVERVAPVRPERPQRIEPERRGRREQQDQDKGKSERRDAR